jgi:hypothetical protein
MKLDKFWVVVTPLGDDVEICDCYFEADIGRMELQFQGGLFSTQIVAMFTTEAEARKVAAEIVEAITGVPPDVGKGESSYNIEYGIPGRVE